MSSVLAELENCVFGRLTARWFVGYVGKGRMYHWLCSCECGNLAVVSVGNLRAGNSKSCGCLQKQVCSKRMTTHGMDRTPEQSMWAMAKIRAKRKGLPFDLQMTDIVIPERCPMLGIVLVQGNGRLHDASPTLDRQVADKGYVKGNVRVISYKANRAKNNLTLEEMKLMVRNW
jgi:hypothetical protein